MRVFECFILVDVRISYFESIRHADKELLQKLKVTSLCAFTEGKGVVSKSLFSLLDPK